MRTCYCPILPTFPLPDISTGWVNHFIPYLATRHRMVTKVNKLLWLKMYSAPSYDTVNKKSDIDAFARPMENMLCCVN